MRGPLGSGVIGEGRIFVEVDGTTIWNTSIPDLPARQTWFSVDNLPVNITGAGSSLNFSIGIIVDQTFDLNSDQDNDGDGYADGIANTVYLTAWFDDISFIGQASPEFESVDMQFAAGASTTPISGLLGTGSAIIVNSTNWQTNPVYTSISSNTSISFYYEVKLLSHKYLDSNSATSLSEIGVNYQVNSDTNPELSFYTYLGSLGSYQNLNISIDHPYDWENVTIYDPQSADVTSQCEFYPGVILIPNTLLIDRLGWWFISIRSPNYIDSLVPEIYDSDGDQWNLESIFRSGNRSRIAVSIGSGTNIPNPLNQVNITWMLPEGPIWFNESLSGGIMGGINSSELVFGSLNTTAGLWQVLVAWTNGTELAFGSTNFEIHHGAILSPHDTDIETESGLTISNYVYFQDSENSEFLMDPTATITANWSATTVTFVPIPLENRWSGNFDTSLVGPGVHLVVVNASRPFFDAASCTFVLTIRFTDNDLIIENPTAEIGIGDTYKVNFSYSDALGIGIHDADVSITYTGTADGITWSDFNNTIAGNYSIEFTAVHSGSYAISISASKLYYEEGKDALFILVGEKSTSLSLENGTSAVISYGEQYRLVVRYTNGTGFGLDGATVSVIDATPETGIDFTNGTNEGNGYFSFNLTPTDTGTYTLLINASYFDHKTQFISFTLTATTIPTELRIASGLSSASVGVQQPFDILIFFEQTGGTSVNISSALIEVTFTSYETLEFSILPQTHGYLLQFTTDSTGLYEFTISASKTGYQSDNLQFSLIIRERALRIEMEPLVWEQLSDLNITLELFEVDTGDSISDATVTYRLYRLLGVEMQGFLNETSTGVYSASIRPLWYDGSGYTIRIFVEKENYALDQEYEFPILQTTPPNIVLQLFFETYLPPIIGIAAVSIGSLTGRLVYVRRKKAELAIDLANKRRFDDADNIIGVIVMHKKSGIPVYSRIVKGGFEEGIVAAFISAVTHFRQEFEMFDEEAMKVIPISDIIRAVQTRNLICAFITMRSASIEHNRKMEDYGMQVATYLDDFYTESRPTGTLDSRIAEILDYVYDETMDGNLIKFYKADPDQKFPRRYRILEQLFEDIVSHHCSRPVYLAHGLATYGVSEAHGCTLVLEAIEKSIIVQCEEHEPTIEDMEFTDFFKKRNNEDTD